MFPVVIQYTDISYMQYCREYNNYLRNGICEFRFYLINMRHDYIVGFFRGGQQLLHSLYYTCSLIVRYVRERDVIL